MDFGFTTLQRRGYSRRRYLRARGHRPTRYTGPTAAPSLLAALRSGSHHLRACMGPGRRRGKLHRCWALRACMRFQRLPRSQASDMLSGPREGSGVHVAGWPSSFNSRSSTASTPPNERARALIADSSPGGARGWIQLRLPMPSAPLLEASS